MVISALHVIQGRDGSGRGQQKIAQLRDNANYFRARLLGQGYNVLGDWDSPVMVRPPACCAQWSCVRWAGVRAGTARHSSPHNTTQPPISRTNSPTVSLVPSASTPPAAHHDVQPSKAARCLTLHAGPRPGHCSGARAPAAARELRPDAAGSAAADAPARHPRSPLSNQAVYDLSAPAPARRRCPPQVGFPATPLLTARMRVCISASHTKADLDYALEVFEEVVDRWVCWGVCRPCGEHGQVSAEMRGHCRPIRSPPARPLTLPGATCTTATRRRRRGT